LTEKLKHQRLEKAKVSKEKEFIYGEKVAGDKEIEEKKQLLEDIKAQYQKENEMKDEIIDSREGEIETLTLEIKKAKDELNQKNQ